MKRDRNEARVGRAGVGPAQGCDWLEAGLSMTWDTGFVTVCMCVSLVSSPRTKEDAPVASNTLTAPIYVAITVANSAGQQQQQHSHQSLAFTDDPAP